MPKSRRLIDAWMALAGRRTFTVNALAEELGVSRRTALRYLHELGEMGVPLAARPGPGGGFHLIRDRVLPPISFTVEEAVALFFALHALKSYAALPFSMDAESAVWKLWAQLPERARWRVERLKDRLDLSVGRWSPPTPYLAALLDAALEGSVLEIVYDSARGPERRTIQPIGIYARDGLWYCPAYCFTREDLRLFRTDRVKEARLSDRVDPRDDVRALTLASYDGQSGKPRIYRMTAALSPEGSRVWGDTQRLLRHPDGSATLEMDIEARDIPFFGRRFLSMGTDAVVQEPRELVEWIRVQVGQLQKLYATKDAPPFGA